MRLRHKPWAKEKLAEYSDIVISNPKEHFGKWTNLFGNNHPIHIEIGTGKGQFIYGMAKKFPEVNFIGMERYDSAIVSALDRLIEAPLPNVRLLNEDAEELNLFFKSNELERVYLNFSDPWPKNRHEKRRLTYKSFLDIYKAVLMQNGEIHLKTDNQGLFEYSLESFARYGMIIKNVSLNLHKSGDKEDNVMTEYEEKFVEKGYPIYRCEAEYRS